MAQIEAWLINRLNSDTDLIAAIGTDKVYPIIAKKHAEEPYITTLRTSTTRNYTTRKNDGLPKATFDINCWDTNYARLKTWSDIVRQLVDGFQGDVGDFKIRRAFVTDEFDNPEPLDPGAELPLFTTRFVLEVVHTEEVTTYTT